jgi:hypothetical protein
LFFRGIIFIKREDYEKVDVCKNQKEVIMKTKGQAAMEFLMTYGWAILAAIIVIGVLAVYFRPSSLTQNSVVVTAPLYGSGVTIAAGQIQVEIQNNGGEDITTSAAALSFNSPAAGSCDAGTGVGAVSAGATQVITFANCNLAASDTVNADLSVSYTRPGTTLTLTATGSVSGAVP